MCVEDIDSKIKVGVCVLVCVCVCMSMFVGLVEDIDKIKVECCVFEVISC